MYDLRRGGLKRRVGLGSCFGACLGPKYRKLNVGEVKPVREAKETQTTVLETKVLLLVKTAHISAVIQLILSFLSCLSLL